MVSTRFIVDVAAAAAMRDPCAACVDVGLGVHNDVTSNGSFVPSLLLPRTPLMWAAIAPHAGMPRYAVGDHVNTGRSQATGTVFDENTRGCCADEVLDRDTGCVPHLFISEGNRWQADVVGIVGGVVLPVALVSMPRTARLGAGLAMPGMVGRVGRDVADVAISSTKSIGASVVLAEGLGHVGLISAGSFVVEPAPALMSVTTPRHVQVKAEAESERTSKERKARG